MPYHFDNAEMDELASRIAEKLLPILVETLKSKATWTVGQLQGEYYTASQLAKMLNVSTQTIYTLAKEKKLASVKVGKVGVRFARQDIDQARKDGVI